jgi:hypothetical protein
MTSTMEISWYPRSVNIFRLQAGDISKAAQQMVGEYRVEKHDTTDILQHPRKMNIFKQ